MINTNIIYIIFQYKNQIYTPLTEETSKGNINTISSEKYHAISTEIVTIICCLYTFPYLYNSVAAK